jgi:hypothetical protein
VPPRASQLPYESTVPWARASGCLWMIAKARADLRAVSGSGAPFCAPPEARSK